MAFPLLPLIATALGGLAYGEYQRKRSAKKANAANATKSTTDDAKSAIQNIYNYNGLNNSNLGRTLFQDPGEDANDPLRRKTVFS